MLQSSDILIAAPISLQNYSHPAAYNSLRRELAVIIHLSLQRESFVAKKVESKALRNTHLTFPRYLQGGSERMETPVPFAIQKSFKGVA